MSIADAFFGRNQRRPFVTKQVHVEAETNDRLREIAKRDGKTQQQLLGEFIEEGIQRRQNGNVV